MSLCAKGKNIDISAGALCSGIWWLPVRTTCAYGSLPPTVSRTSSTGAHSSKVRGTRPLGGMSGVGVAGLVWEWLVWHGSGWSGVGVAGLV